MSERFGADQLLPPFKERGSNAHQDVWSYLRVA
jgi:hypothetical protein